MQDMQDMMRRLNQSGKRLSKGHRKIAEYIVEHYDKAVFMTASKLGEKVGIAHAGGEGKAPDTARCARA